MSLLPVAERELRLAARLPRTYRSRALAAIFVATVSLGMLYAGFSGSLGAASAGRGLFLMLSLCAGFYVLLDGAIMTADCLSQEKRDGTLGLLFLTDLKGYDIVAGKFISRTANSACCLLAALPAALGIALFLGGVRGREFLTMMLALLNGLFFAAAFGMLASAMCRAERRALSLAVLGVLGFSLLLPALGWALSVFQATPTVHPAFLLGSPAGAFWSVLDSGAMAPNLSFTFGRALLTAHAVGWLFLIIASVILPRGWRETGSQFQLRWGQSCGRRRWGNHRAPSRPWQEDNPLIVAAHGRGRLRFWPVLLVFALAWIIGWASLRHTWFTLPWYVASVIVLHLGLMFVVLLQACRGPGYDRRSGVLEILLTTPIGSDIYLRGRLLSLKRQTVGPLFLVLAADAGLLVVGCWQMGSPSWQWIAWVAVFLALAAKLVIDLYALSWVGFWQGLKAPSASQAIRMTIIYLFLLRWIILLGCLAFLGIITSGRFFQSPAGAVIGAGYYLVLLVGTVLCFCAAAVSDLRDNLQVLAIGSDKDQ